MRTQQAQPDVWRTEAANHEDHLGAGCRGWDFLGNQNIEHVLCAISKLSTLFETKTKKKMT